jgi:hypothetical protein
MLAKLFRLEAIFRTENKLVGLKELIYLNLVAMQCYDQTRCGAKYLYDLSGKPPLKTVSTQLDLSPLFCF